MTGYLVIEGGWDYNYYQYNVYTLRPRMHQVYIMSNMWADGEYEINTCVHVTNVLTQLQHQQRLHTYTQMEKYRPSQASDKYLVVLLQLL